MKGQAKNQKLILYKVLDLYPNNNFINKGLSTFRNFICDATNYKYFVLIWISANEGRRCIVFILGDIYIFLY